MRKESLRNVRGVGHMHSRGSSRFARQTTKKAVEGEITGALGMSKVGLAVLQDNADDGSIQRCQHLRPITPPEIALFSRVCLRQCSQNVANDIHNTGQQLESVEFVITLGRD